MKKSINLNRNIEAVLSIAIALLGFGCSSTVDMEESLTALASAYTAQNAPPGLAVSVIKDGRPFWSYTYGYADVEKEIPLDTTVIMNIGSVSKTITTTAVLQLWENGKLNLNEDVSEYLNFVVRNPNYEEEPITVKHLLTHTSSIKDSKAYQESYRCGASDVPLSEWIGNYFTVEGRYYSREDNFHEWEPGDGYKYSNVAYGLLGLIVEEVSGQPFSEYCAEKIFTPLEMHNSAWFRKDIDTSKQSKQYALRTKENQESAWMSKLIAKKAGEFYELCDYSFYNYPDGLFKTTIQELSHFMMVAMNEGQYGHHQILKPSTVKEMLTLQVENYDIQGLGWKKINYENFSFWGHSGRDPGVRTHMYFGPETGIGIILFQNNDEGTTIDLVEDIYSLMIAESNK